MYRNTFRHALANTLVASVVNYTVWFAVTFWVYLETHSVFATGVVSGIFLVLTALTGIWFGSLVDHLRKKMMLLVSAGVMARSARHAARTHRGTVTAASWAAGWTRRPRGPPGRARG